MLESWVDKAGSHANGGSTGDSNWYRDLVERLPVVVYVGAPDGTNAAVYVSPQSETMLGYAQEAWTSDGGLWEKILHPEDRERILAETARVRESGEPFRAEYRLVSKSGDVVWVLDEATPVRDKEGGTASWRGVMLDITERKESEEKLRESEKRFRTTFDAAAVGMAHVAPDGRWVRVNPKFCEIVGYGKAELLGRTFWEITPEEELDASRERYRRLLEGSIGPYSVERRFVRKDGYRVWVKVTASAVRKYASVPDYFICVVEDITESKLLELVPEPLTDGELEVLHLLSRGLTNRQIAEELAYSMGNIKHLVQGILKKLGIEDRRQAVARAEEIGLIPVPH